MPRPIRRTALGIAALLVTVLAQTPSRPPVTGGTGNQDFCKSDAACFTPARGAQCPEVRFGWGNCPGSKQACDWCYGPNGVFAYTPRGSVYTLNSRCNQFDSNTIWSTQDPQVAQWMGNSGGNCTPDGRGGSVCSNVDPAQFKQAACGNQQPGVCPRGQTFIAQLTSLYSNSAGQCTGCCKTCVDLPNSKDATTGATDRAVAGMAINTYNCHFYTLTLLNLLNPGAPGRRTPTPYKTVSVFGQTIETSSECIDDRDLTNYGFSKVQSGSVDPARLQVGDVVTVYWTSLVVFRCRNAHSGVVIQAGPNVMIRQKPDPFTCVIDLTWREFQTTYGLTGSGVGVNAWRRPSL